jgi:hypothetical protein
MAKFILLRQNFKIDITGLSGEQLTLLKKVEDMFPRVLEHALLSKVGVLNDPQFRTYGMHESFNKETGTAYSAVYGSVLSCEDVKVKLTFT